MVAFLFFLSFSEKAKILEYFFDNLKDFHNTVAKIEEDKVIGGFISLKEKNNPNLSPIGNRFGLF